jgi:hypothetical protein
MTAVPQSVRRQNERAEELVRQHAESRNTGEEPAPKAVQSDPAPVVAAPAQPAQPQAAAELDAAKKEAESWRQRYLVLQGKYDKEVPALSRQVGDLTEQIKELKLQLEQHPIKAPVSEEDRERFGADMIDVVTRISAHVAETTVKPIKDQVNTVKQTTETVAQETQRTAEQRFWADFDKLLADKGLTFDPINNDPGFVKWLGEVDGLSGVTRQTMLDQAISKHDAPRAALFFTTYVDGLPKGDAASLTQQIQPDTSAPGSDPLNSPKGKIWTRADIAKFHDDVRRGHYKGKEAEARGIEEDIAAAYKEGRIR